MANGDTHQIFSDPKFSDRFFALPQDQRLLESTDPRYKALPLDQRQKILGSVREKYGKKTAAPSAIAQAAPQPVADHVVQPPAAQPSSAPAKPATKVSDPGVSGFGSGFLALDQNSHPQYGRALGNQIIKHIGGLTEDEQARLHKWTALDPEKTEQIAEQSKQEPPTKIPVYGMYGPGSTPGLEIGGEQRAEQIRTAGTVARAAIGTLNSWYSPAMLLLSVPGRIGGEITSHAVELKGAAKAIHAEAMEAATDAYEFAQTGRIAEARVAAEKANKLFEEAYKKAGQWSKIKQLVAGVSALNAALGTAYTASFAAQAVKDWKEGKHTDAVADILGAAGSLVFAGAAGYGAAKALPAALRGRTAPKVEIEPTLIGAAPSETAAPPAEPKPVKPTPPVEAKAKPSETRAEKRLDPETRREIDAIIEEKKHIGFDRSDAIWLLAKQRMGIEGAPTPEQADELAEIEHGKKPMPPRREAPAVPESKIPASPEATVPAEPPKIERRVDRQTRMEVDEHMRLTGEKDQKAALQDVLAARKAKEVAPKPPEPITKPEAKPPQEAELRKTVEDAGGKFGGIQEGSGKIPSTAVITIPQAGNTSINIPVNEITTEHVKERILEKVKQLSASSFKPGDTVKATGAKGAVTEGLVQRIGRNSKDEVVVWVKPHGKNAMREFPVVDVSRIGAEKPTIESETKPSAALQRPPETEVQPPPEHPAITPQPTQDAAVATAKRFTKEKGDAAFSRLRDKFKKKPSDVVFDEFDHDTFQDLVDYGGYLMESGLKDFDGWKKKITDDLGEEVQSYLKPVWDELAEIGAQHETPSQPLGQTSEGTLEGKPSDVVPATGEGGGTGEGSRGGGRADLEIDGNPPSERPDVGAGLGVRQPGIHLPAERGGGPADGPGETGERGSDYLITESDHLGEGGPIRKFQDNLAAIKTLKAIQAENRLATPDEQKILVRYVGWGSLKKAFEYNQDRRFQQLAKELEGLLTEDEFRSARASTINAHYTSVPVVRGIYHGLTHLGFKSGKVLEAGSGIGNFRGLMPPALLKHTAMTMVERDPISAAISKLLYPSANVLIKEYQAAHLPRNFFDAAVGNVPFADIHPHDPEYNKLGLTLHNYFIVKSLDRLRPGGVIAVITSRHTMDSLNDKARDEMAKRADLIGAIRLPDSAFKENAGTEVTTDILFFKRRAPDGVQAGQKFIELGEVKDPQTGSPIRINQYFVEHPEMMLGKMTLQGTMYGKDEPTLKGDPTADLLTSLNSKLENLPKDLYRPASSGPATTPKAAGQAISKEGIEVKPYGYVYKDGKVYQSIDDKLVPQDFNRDQVARLNGMLQIRDVARRLLSSELRGEEGSGLRNEALRRQLNQLYDAFRGKYGPLSARTNKNLIEDDPEAPFIQALENISLSTGDATKADIFSKPTVNPSRIVDSVEKASDAMMLSLAKNARLDFPYMEHLTGKTQDELIKELGSLAYRNPEGDWEEAEQYASGNIRHKLKVAEEAAKIDPTLQRNVESLKAVMPEDVSPANIMVNLGASFIQPVDYEDFIKELLKVPYSSTTVRYSPIGSLWSVTPDNRAKGSPENIHTWGTGKITAIELVEYGLSGQSPTVWAKDAHGKKIIDGEQTEAAREKLRLIEEEFRKWIWKDTARGLRIAKVYNETFNSLRNRQYDGSHLDMPGLNPIFKPHPHQKNAVWRIARSEGNTLTAHIMGAGKTATFIMAAMELRRLGLARKPVLNVKKSTLTQYRTEFQRLYPAANVLIPTEQDFEAKNRNKLMSKIATGDWDAVVVTHPQFNKLPISDENFKKFINEQIDELTAAIQQAQEDSPQGKRDRMVKQLEKAKERLQEKLKSMADRETKDTAINWEDTGADFLFVDESQAYKRLFFSTRLGRVAGVPTQGSDRAMDLYIKSRLVQEKNGGKGLVFGTGTPISNTLAEAYVLQRYLDEPRLKEMGIHSFDAWAKNFSQTITDLEYTTYGTIKPISRMSAYQNIPELQSIFHSFADVKMAEDLKLPVPEVITGKPIVVKAKMSEWQKAFIRGLVQRAEDVKAGVVPPTVDNYLKITTDGRKASVSRRLIEPEARDEPGSKLEMVAAEVHKLWSETAKDRSTQFVFLDFGTPGDPKKYNAYTDIRQYLLDLGVPKAEIAFIHDPKNELALKRLFEQVNSGEVRIIFGSTEKAGIGVNVQERMIAANHVDVGWRPDDFQQRNGRVIRHGNKNPSAYLKVYITQGEGDTPSFDAVLYQKLETKQRFIDQFLKNESNLRTMSVSDGPLTFDEIKAIASGNPVLKEHVQVSRRLNTLRSLNAQHSEHKWAMKKRLSRIPGDIKSTEEHIVGTEQDVKTRDANNTGKFTIKLGGEVLDERKAAGEKLIQLNKEATADIDYKIGEFMGFDVLAMKVPEHAEIFNEWRRYFRGALTHSFTLNLDSALGTVASLERQMASLGGDLDDNRRMVEALKREAETLVGQVDQPFQQEGEYNTLQKRLREIEDILNPPKGDVHAAPATPVPDEVSGEEADEDAPPPDSPSIDFHSITVPEEGPLFHELDLHTSGSLPMEQRRTVLQAILRDDVEMMTGPNGEQVAVLNERGVLPRAELDKVLRSPYWQKHGAMVHNIVRRIHDRSGSKKKLEHVGLYFPSPKDPGRTVFGVTVTVPYSHGARSIFINPLGYLEASIHTPSVFAADNPELMSVHQVNTSFHEVAHVEHEGEKDHWVAIEELKNKFTPQERDQIVDEWKNGVTGGQGNDIHREHKEVLQRYLEAKRSQQGKDVAGIGQGITSLGPPSGEVDFRNIRPGDEGTRPSGERAESGADLRPFDATATDGSPTGVGIPPGISDSSRLRAEGVELVATADLLPLRMKERENWPLKPNDKTDLSKLRNDILDNGITDPLVIEFDPKTNQALLTDGNHRLYLAARLGLRELPVKVKRVEKLSGEGVDVAPTWEAETPPARTLSPGDIGFNGRPVPNSSATLHMALPFFAPIDFNRVQGLLRSVSGAGKKAETFYRELTTDAFTDLGKQYGNDVASDFRRASASTAYADYLAHEYMDEVEKTFKLPGGKIDTEALTKLRLAFISERVGALRMQRERAGEKLEALPNIREFTPAEWESLISDPRIQHLLDYWGGLDKSGKPFGNIYPHFHELGVMSGVEHFEATPHGYFIPIYDKGELEDETAEPDYFERLKRQPMQTKPTGDLMDPQKTVSRLMFTGKGRYTEDFGEMVSDAFRLRTKIAYRNELAGSLKKHRLALTDWMVNWLADRVQNNDVDGMTKAIGALNLTTYQANRLGSWIASGKAAKELRQSRGSGIKLAEVILGERAAVEHLGVATSREIAMLFERLRANYGRLEDELKGADKEKHGEIYAKFHKRFYVILTATEKRAAERFGSYYMPERVSGIVQELAGVNLRGQKPSPKLRALYSVWRFVRDLFTSGRILSGAELTGYTSRMLGQAVAVLAPEMRSPYLRAINKFGVAKLTTLFQAWPVLDTAEGKRISRTLARAGGLNPRIWNQQMDVLKSILYGGQDNPWTLPGTRSIVAKPLEFLEMLRRKVFTWNGLDHRLRVAVAKAYMDAYRHHYGNEPSEGEVSQFVNNRFGNYIKLSQGPAVKVLMETGLDPFAAIQMAMIFQEYKNPFGATGMPGNDWTSERRWNSIAAAILGPLIALMVMNIVLGGKFPWDNEPGHELDISLENLPHGKGLYFPGLTIFGELFRPARIAGILGYIGELNLRRQAGINAPKEQSDKLPKPEYSPELARGVSNQLASTVSGPLFQSLFIARWGRVPWMTKTGEMLRVVAPQVTLKKTFEHRAAQSLISWNPIMSNWLGDNTRRYSDLHQEIFDRVVSMFTPGLRAVNIDEGYDRWLAEKGFMYSERASWVAAKAIEKPIDQRAQLIYDDLKSWPEEDRMRGEVLILSHMGGIIAGQATRHEAESSLHEGRPTPKDEKEVEQYRQYYRASRIASKLQAEIEETNSDRTKTQAEKDAIIKRDLFQMYQVLFESSSNVEPPGREEDEFTPPPVQPRTQVPAEIRQ